MTEFMTYRGPDAQNIWIDGAVGFGHTLLATTFESVREHQPCSLNGQVWITADARIDGRADLIAKLSTPVSLRVERSGTLRIIGRGISPHYLRF